ncbi:MAG: hypothetical protein H7338_07395 [Candidatus Sericytochromatia bacterium]|nr:hypothetical protein [Candidatus Sericytochromatia bacterium]
MALMFDSPVTARRSPNGDPVSNLGMIAGRRTFAIPAWDNRSVDAVPRHKPPRVQRVLWERDDELDP